MPVLKQIAGHTSAKGVREYLIHDGRALAQDFLNLSWDDLTMGTGDESFKQTFDWASEMDATREAFGNDAQWRGLRARTWMHYVLSPDPKDEVSLEQLRSLAQAWAHENFPNHEAAICYHADNDGKIPHAHIVVNNTDLETGYRLQVPKPRLLSASLQRLAAEHGMTSLDAEPEAADGFAALARNRESRAPQPKTRQETYLRRAEAELNAKGQYSWVSDIRNRVTVARELAASAGEFEQILDLLGVNMRENSPSAQRSDWVFSLEGHPTWKISGESMGLAFGKTALEARFARSDATTWTPAASRELMVHAIEYVEIEDWAQLSTIANAMEVSARFGIHSMADFDVRIERLQERAKGEIPSKAAATQRSIDALEKARGTAAMKELLPAKSPAQAMRNDDSDDDARSSQRRNQRTHHRKQAQHNRSSRRRDR